VQDDHRVLEARTGVALVAAISFTGFAQRPALSIFDGTTPGMNVPGTPAEAYRLSDIDTVNALTGRLNIVIPLADIPGRSGVIQMRGSGDMCSTPWQRRGSLPRHRRVG
jgi:hypothetical protein